MIGRDGIFPCVMSYSSFTASLPQPKYFWPISTATRPSRSRSSAGWIVSNASSFVFAGSIAALALRVKTGQPPVEIQAARSG
jgi:hypothetical protein